MDNMDTDMASPAFSMPAFTPGFSDHGTPATNYDTPAGTLHETGHDTPDTQQDSVEYLFESDLLQEPATGERNFGDRTPLNGAQLRIDRTAASTYSIISNPSALLRSQANITEPVSIKPSNDDQVFSVIDRLLLQITTRFHRISVLISVFSKNPDISAETSQLIQLLGSALKAPDLEKLLGMPLESLDVDFTILGLKAFSLYAQFFHECCFGVLASGSGVNSGNTKVLLFMSETIRVGVAQLVQETFRLNHQPIPNLDPGWHFNRRGRRSAEGHKFCTLAVVYQTLQNGLPELPGSCPACAWSDISETRGITFSNPTSFGTDRIYLTQSFLMKSHLEQSHMLGRVAFYGCLLCPGQEIRVFYNATVLLKHLVSEHPVDMLKERPDIMIQRVQEGHNIFGSPIPQP